MKEHSEAWPTSFKRSSHSMVRKNLPIETIDLSGASQENQSKSIEEKEVQLIDSSHSKSPSPAKKQKTPNVSDDDEEEFYEIETKRPKFNFFAHKQKLTSPAPDPAAFEVPQGQENCLDGLTFVLTGDLQALGREEAKDFVKRLGGRITTMPSSKTSFVVVGQDAGPSKLAKVKELHLKTLNEQQFYDFVKEAPAKKLSAVQAPPTAQAKPNPIPSVREFVPSAAVPVATSISELPLPQKYAPRSIGEVIGNQTNVSRLISWLRAWNPNAKGTKENMRAALLSGPPGIGKTTTAILACKSLGLVPIEFNASDSRSKGSLEDTVKTLIGNRGCDEYFSTNYFPNSNSKVNQVLIMDEVDGMSSGDRGGMAHLISFIRTTKIPIICICNDRNASKVRSLSVHCLDLRFRKLESRNLAERMGEIARKEGLSIQPNAMEQIVASCQSDMRQILNVLTWMKLGKKETDQAQSAFNFDQAKHLNSLTKKDTEQGIFDVIAELFSGYSRTSLADKVDAYFVDMGIIPLMVHENYLHGSPFLGEDTLETAFKAADSFSTSDIVDSVIQKNQQYSLCPFHAILTCAIPTFWHGNGMRGRIDFPSWLGQNSKQLKNSRLLRQIKMHIFLSTSVPKTQLRLFQLPEMTMRLLQFVEKDQLVEAVQFLDDYTLLKEDFDDMMEICIGPLHTQEAYSKIATSVKKTAFTKLYNKTAHSIPYAITAAPAAKKSKDDEESESEAVDEDSVQNDKMIKQVVKKVPKKKAPK